MIGIILCFLLTVLPYSEQKAPVLSAKGDGLLHIYALPVGQGDGTIIQCPNGDIAIVDLGSSTRKHNDIPDVVLPMKRVKGSDNAHYYMTDDELKDFLGDTNVKYVFITHADTDHYNLFVKIDPKRLQTVIEAYVGCEAEDYKEMQEWLKKYKVQYNPKLGNVVSICHGSMPEVNVKVMAINTDKYNLGCSNSNSMALRLEYGTFSLFLPGDLENYDSFNYDDNGVITSDLKGIYGKPGVLKIVSDTKGIRSTVYRLAHHGAWPNANPPYFLKAIQPKYVFSSSKLPGTDGSYNHPNCDLYDKMIDMTNHGQLPIIKYPTNPPQKDYFCGKKKERYHENNNEYGIFTTAAMNNGRLINYFIQIDADGKKDPQVTPKLWR
eukprot:Em0006g903a